VGLLGPDFWLFKGLFANFGKFLSPNLVTLSLMLAHFIALTKKLDPKGLAIHVQ
jgi:hypothetical protein